MSGISGSDKPNIVVKTPPAKPPKSVVQAKSAKPSRRRKRNDKTNSDDWLNGAIYADFGVGKTYLVGTCELVPEMKEVLFLNVDFGSKGLPENFEGDIYDIRSYSELANAYEFAKSYVIARDSDNVQKMRELEARLFEEDIENIGEPKRYRTIIIDDLSDVQRLNKYQLLGIDLATTKLDEIPEYMKMRDWGSTLEMILQMLSGFRALKMHTLFVITVADDEDDKKKKFYRPALQGQAKSEILGYFDFVGYYTMIVPQATNKAGALMAEGDVLRRLYLAPVGPFKAKNRFAKLKGFWLDNPTMKDIYDLL